MEYINFSAPFNDLSLGNVSVNLAYEMYKRDMKVNIFPVSNQIHLSAYHWVDEQFARWIVSNTEVALERLRPDQKSLKLWHINGSETKLPNQTLFTFHETNEATKTESAICNLQDNVIFSSTFSREIFEKEIGVKAKYVPLGFDSESFFLKVRKNTNKIIFGLIGKWEKRKNTERLISLWLKEYGNKPEFHLYCLVDNPFFQKEHQDQLKARALMGKTWSNITFFERMKKNSQVNDLMNFIDIDIGGLSNGEGWNLPSFNMTALGKYSLVLNFSAHKDWANQDNSILIEPDGFEEVYDGAFFQKGQKFNQGSYAKVNDDKILFAFEEGISAFKKNPLNEAGLELRKMTYSDSLDKILSILV